LQTDSKDGSKCFGRTGGNVRHILVNSGNWFTVYGSDTIDSILAACDVEGNFLVVKVSVSRMFIYPLSPLRHFIGVPIYRSIIVHASGRVSCPYSQSLDKLLIVMQMGNPSVSVFLLDLHADQIPLDPTPR
jgi:hypothetical protein